MSETDKRLVVGAVQCMVSKEIYSSIESFRSAVETSLDRLENAAGDRSLDLAVFPKYTSTFLTLAYLKAGEIEALIAHPDSNREIAADALLFANRQLQDMWQRVAQSRGYAILAGTTLVPETKAGPSNRG